MGVDLSTSPGQCPSGILEIIDKTSGYVVYCTSSFPQPGSAFFRFINALMSPVTDAKPCEDASTTNHKLESANLAPDPWMFSPDNRVTLADPAEFDQASMDSIHAHFETWKISQEKLDRSATNWKCIIYDEASQHAFLSSPSVGRYGHIELGEEGIPTAHYRKDIAPISDHDDDSYDGFMGGERSDRMGIDMDSHKRGMRVLSDSDDDEYDGFLGGSI